MRARVPLDVDLEDRIVYGLTPTRLAYAVLAGLAAMAAWSLVAIAAPVRVAVAVVLIVAGVVLAWGRWRGRPVDGWLIDVAIFVWSTRRVSWHGK
jgi:hypothetical protein